MIAAPLESRHARGEALTLLESLCSLGAFSNDACAIIVGMPAYSLAARMADRLRSARA